MQILDLMLVGTLICLVLWQLRYQLTYLWALPSTLLLLAFCLPMWAALQVAPFTFERGVWLWIVMPGSWWDRFWCIRGRWDGVSIGWVTLINYRAYSNKRLLKHEYRHTIQNMLLGPLFLPVYGLIWLFLLLDGATARQAYHEHPFEKDAREYADGS